MKNLYRINYELYITTWDSIKYKDFVLYNNTIIRLVDDTFNKPGYDWNNLNCYKIILTTDKYLIKNGIQAIENEFLEWFVNNQSCEFVNVKKDYLVGYYILPKEEPKQEFHACKYCGAETTQPDDECYAKPKQELKEVTLKQIAEAFKVYVNNLKIVK
jgi:hypothetical protein